MNGPLLISANGWVLNQRTLVTTASSTLTNGYLLVNNGAAISNTASGVFDIPDDSSLLNNAGVGAFLNAGVLEKTGEGNNSSGQGASNSVVSIVLTNSGTVVAQSGTLKFTGGYFQTGGATEVNGGTLSSTTPLNILGGSVIGNGTILGTVLNNGVISPGVSGAGSLSLGGPLTNQAGATMLFQLGGYTPGVSCDFLSVSNRALLAGNLAVQFINNYSFISTVTNGASFTVANCPSNFAGAFANVANGGVLTSADDFATFTVTYSGSNIVLSSLNILYSVGDGIPNWWRTEFFGSPNTTNQFSCASCDPDGSGFSNLQAYQAGMNPLVPSTAFRILAIQPVGNDVHVTWNTAGGHTNMLQVVTGEVGGSFTNTFEDLPPQIIVTGSGDTMTNQLDVGGATNTPARYYRVRLVQ
jgi:hypothetical protein